MPKPTHYGYSMTTIRQPWTLNIALLRFQNEVAKFDTPQIKRRYNVFLICPVAHPSPLRASGCLTVQIYKDYLNWQKNNAKRMNYSKGCLSAPCLIHRTNCGNNKNLWSIAEQI